jgi:hypothetical protein
MRSPEFFFYIIDVNPSIAQLLVVGLNIGDGYQDYEGFEVEVDIKVIEVRFENVGGCQGNAC